MDTPLLDPGFREHLLGIADVSERDFDKLLAELFDHWAETQSGYVVRRHKELQRHGVPNREIYGALRSELKQRRFAAKRVSERQIRRLLYG